ncbi:hypothetical protein [Paenibacillus daejeonensis]|uniref:hypothetical protein n=1 Tax=Paenibacillus daejeonensis TaxID=135193 RepID=UPI00037CE045|nr:hypothetical protein [Paenibacillus daejeonensis]
MSLKVEIVENQNETTDIRGLLPLFNLLSNCILEEGYRPPSISKHVALTDYGEKWKNIILKEFRDVTIDEICFAFLILCFHKDALINAKRTNLPKILEILEMDISERKIIFPWIYGMDLYLKFNTKFHSDNEELNYTETNLLLDNTPAGVFQVNNLVVGPFGFLESLENRIHHSSLYAPLSYCSDPTCNSLHVVTFKSGNNIVRNLVDFLQEKMKDYEGPQNEDLVLQIETKRDLIDWHEDFHLEDIIWLLANAFTDDELRILLNELFTKHSKSIRRLLPMTEKYKDKWRMASEEIVEGLMKNECLQIILLLTDEEIVESLENLIQNGGINIPITETRDSFPRRGPYGWLKMTLECSHLGIRSMPTIHGQAIGFTRLRNLIEELYAEERSKLEWKLRHSKGTTFLEKLNKYLLDKDPKVIVNELLLDTREHIQGCFAYLKYGYFFFPENELEDERIIKKILWKLGFNQESFPLTQSTFWERYSKFKSVVTEITSRDEDDKEIIRSEAVNFFVSLEEILENSLSFVSWMLLSDHFIETRFSYNFDKGLDFLAKTLNGRPFGANEVLTLDQNGKNTLFPLITGFGILANMCEEHITKSDDYKRNEEQMPHFNESTNLVNFPFKHKLLLLDVSVTEVTNIISILKKVTRNLEMNQVSNIRNRIKHKHNGSNFPSIEELENCCKAIETTVRTLEDQGLYPSVVNYRGEMSDQYHRNTIKYVDYKGTEINVIDSAQLTPFGMPEYEPILILVPAIKINSTTENLRFRVKETSKYLEMWKGHPQKG